MTIIVLTDENPMHFENRDIQTTPDRELCKEGGVHFRLTSLDKTSEPNPHRVLFSQWFSKQALNALVSKNDSERQPSDRRKAMEKSSVAFHILQN